MGNNYAFTIFEATVVGAYDLGVLDKKLCAVLMEPYRDCDIDSGGKEGRVSKRDKLEVEDIVIKVFAGKYFAPPKLPEGEWTEDQHKLNEDYHEKRDREFGKITRKFGWS